MLIEEFLDPFLLSLNKTGSRSIFRRMSFMFAWIKQMQNALNFFRLFNSVPLYVSTLAYILF